MEFVKGITFGYMSQRGDWDSVAAKQSLVLLKEKCAANTIILTVVVEQANPQSTSIDWQSETVLSDTEVKQMIHYAKSLDLNVILKPMVNVSDGTWRAHINFFDMDVPCEPKWSDWFKSYNDFILHYADIAEETGCEMFVIGCELVNADRREFEWRQLIHLVRNQYKGLITYNCDKYQEDQLKWWDALDVISSSGYYPIDRWKQELDRIEKVVDKHQKPFFFCEVGCPSRSGSEYLPNDWTKAGELDLNAQANWYKAMFAACEGREWVEGFGLWDWKAHLHGNKNALTNEDYAIYGKPAEKVIYKNYKK